MGWQTNWHFIDQPYYDQGGSAEDYPDFKPGSVRVNDALNALTKFLKDDESVDDSVYVKTIKENFEDDQE